MKFANWLLALVALSTIHAQAAPGILGAVTRVEGVATVTQGDAGQTVAPGIAVHDGMHFVTASRSSVILRLHSGCTIVIPPEHSVTVLESANCARLAAAVGPLQPARIMPASVLASTNAAAVNTNAAVVNGVVLGGAAMIAIQALRLRFEDNRPLSAR